MKRLLLLLLLAAPLRAQEDPWLWLEGVEDPKALAWVEARNAESLPRLSADPRYPAVEAELRAILLAEDRIPRPALRAGWTFNFWQDKVHVRGIWRRVRLERYGEPEPPWELLLDLDALAEKEGENWVWHGSDCLPPESRRCLLSLSRGGKDADVVREFDVEAKAFVSGGFELPEAKSRLAWLDRDAVLVGTDFGPGSLTLSGYPRAVKLWRRGTPLAAAEPLFEGAEDDVSVSPGTFFRPEGSLPVLYRNMTFWTAQRHALLAGERVPIPFPDDAELEAWFDGRLFALLRSSWSAGGALLPAGALVALPVEDLRAPEPRVELVHAPDERSSIRSVGTSRDRLYVGTLENVKGRLYEFERRGRRWRKRRVPFPEGGLPELAAADDFDGRVLAGYESFLVPESLHLIQGPGAKPELQRSLPERFDPAPYAVEQREARSADGTRVPYFLIRPKRFKADGTAPTVLYGYGGFEISQDPYYLDTVGKAWLDRGGVYAIANVRGGGEFGPRWHQAALKENRQRAFDDFIAVAEDLERRKVSSPRKLAVMGGSNGGLLVGAVLVQRPELFGAVICSVPLLDMLRFHKLLAGHSWTGEYGNPDEPALRAAIARYSPYQNVSSEKAYPPTFLITSTKDDRVHPGHARKMTARLLEKGQPALYFENTEGGHSAAANLEQRIKRKALEFAFLLQELMPPGPPPLTADDVGPVSPAP